MVLALNKSIYTVVVFSLLFHLLKERVRPVRVENFVAGHHRHQILGIAQVDDVVRPARDHIHRFDLVPRYLELHHLAGVDVPLLDEAVTVHHDELLPLAVVPVLPLGDARPTDVDGYLPAVLRVHQLREAAAVVHVHLQRVLELVCREIGQV